MARRRQSGQGLRNVEGILLLDKPSGCTSNSVLQQVKRLYKARKAGHTGSLDPLATGMLPLCFGNATKMSAFLLDADKRYRVTARVGARTDTGDAEGTETAWTDVRPDAAALQAAVAALTGEIEQVPPMYSALKHKGERLYKLAREGIEVERKARPVTIHSLALRTGGPDEFALDVHCSKGTYVRTLVEDVAVAAGTLAHVTALRRISVGPFEADGMVTLEALEAAAAAGDETLDSLLQPVESGVAHWPAVQLGRDSALCLMNGQPVAAAGAPDQGWVRLYADQSRFVGLGEVIADGRIAPRRLIRH